MQHPEDLWKALAGRVGITINRPDFRFDPSFYARTYPDLALDDSTVLQDHFDNYGRLEGRHATSYSQLRQEAPYIDTALAELIIDPALKALVEKGHPDALHLAFELIQLGAPIDSNISNFSMQAYLEWHPDIAKAGMNPLMHYLRFGTIEGGRRTLADLRKGLHTGQQQFCPELPTVMICLHEMSQTDTPAVGLDLVRQAGQTHNVAVATLRGGALLDQFLPLCCSVLITENPLREMPYVPAEVFGQIDYAILNSVECALFIHPLVAQDIPFAAYIHEYADCTFPPWKSAYTAAFANLLVFSAEHVRESWQGRLADVTFDTANDSTIMPHRPLIEGQVTEIRRIEARRTLGKALGRDLTNARIICGAGHVQWRKGTDIFVQAAQACSDIDSETVFVWIGDGRNHQDMGFGAWFDYHLRQVGANRKDSNLFFLPAGALYLDVVDAADAMFLSSRLDPLPNAVFDAVQRGCQVVCFEGATGFADARYHGSDRIIRAPYADPAAAMGALLALPRKTCVQEETSAPPIKGPSLFDRIRGALQDRLARQRNFVLGESAFDIPLLFTKSDSDRPLRQREREKLFSYGRRLLWRDVDDARATLTGSDNWVHKRTRLEDYGSLAADDLQVPEYAIHIHAFYIDNLPADLRDHAAYARASRILVTTDTETKATAIRQMGVDQGLKIETHLVPNQGRDILPFLRLFGREGLAGENRIWCHLHQKKSVQTTSHGDVWRRFLHRILLGDRNTLSSAIQRIAQPGVGLVAPFEPHFVPWDDSRRLLPNIADRFPGPMPDNPLLFPVGNMFWTHAEVARDILNLFGEDHAWPNEPIPTDGTEYHLIERLWPAIAARMKLDSVFLHKEDEERV